MKTVVLITLGTLLFQLAGAAPDPATPAAPEMVRARWSPRLAEQHGTRFVLPDPVSGLAIEGTGRVVDDTELADRRALEFAAPAGTNAPPAVRAQTANAFKVGDAIAFTVQVKPAPTQVGSNGATVVYLFTCLELRWRPERKGYSLYVWTDPRTPVQVFVPAVEGLWHTVSARVVGENITLDVDGRVSTGTGHLRAVTASIGLGSADGRPFAGRIGELTFTEPNP